MILRLLIVAALECGFVLLAAYVVQHSVKEALKAVKTALKSEFTTDTGKVNLVGLVLFVFIYVFSSMDDMAANALSVKKPAPAESHLITAVIVFGLVFIGSLGCVAYMERKPEE